MTVARKSNKASVAAKVVVAALALCPMLADAHFTLQSPAFSREKQALPSSNERFFPIAGGGTLRGKLDCLQYPRGQVAQGLQGGQTVTFGFEIGNHASHVGECSASLIDLSSGAVQDLGTESDCVSKHQAMDVKLPTKTCANCVVKIKVVATHLSAANPETYDSCVDVNIGGGSGGGSDDGPSPTQTTAPTTAPTAAPTTPTKTPRKGRGRKSQSEDGEDSSDAGEGNGAGAGAGTDKSQVDSDAPPSPTPAAPAAAPKEPAAEPDVPAVPTIMPYYPSPAAPAIPTTPAAPGAPKAAGRRRPRRSHGRFTGGNSQ